MPKWSVAFLFCIWHLRSELLSPKVNCTQFTNKGQVWSRLHYKKKIKIKIQYRVQAKGFSTSKVKCPGQFSALNQMVFSWETLRSVYRKELWKSFLFRNVSSSGVQERDSINFIKFAFLQFTADLKFIALICKYFINKKLQLNLFIVTLYIVTFF